MCKPVFATLCQRLPQLENSLDMGKALIIEHRLAMAIRRFATTEFRTICNLFGIDRSTVCVCVHVVYDVICAIMFQEVVNVSRCHKWVRSKTELSELCTSSRCQPTPDKVLPCSFHNTEKDGTPSPRRQSVMTSTNSRMCLLVGLAQFTITGYLQTHL